MIRRLTDAVGEPGIMLINVTQALGEMAILYPVSGGFYTLASRMLDPSFAFAMGWNCAYRAYS
jgi:amino acid transporter